MSKQPVYPLVKVKELVVNRRVNFAYNRKKNRETLKKLGLEIDDALKYIMKLTVDDYSGVSHEDGKADADVYHKTILSMNVYIKFKIQDPNLLILSFHEDEP